MNCVDNSTKLTVLSLCSGYAGLELGLAGALANPMRVVAVEIEAYALANLAAKAQEGRLAIEAMWPDIKTFPAERFRGCFDFILAGYPCQPFSIAGKRQGKNDPRHLWPYIARIVETVRPLWCIFENVPGHLSLGFPDVYISLQKMGYKVEAGLFTAAEVGAPHRRKRLFILAKSCRTTSGDQNGQADGLLGQEDVPQGNGATGTIRAGAASQLADAECPGAGERIIKEAQAGIGGTGLAEQRPVMADATGTGSQTERATPEIKCTEPFIGNRWPARPGQSQYEWEEPRVVMSRLHSSFLKGYVEKYKTKLTERQIEELAYACDSYEIEPAMGKSTHGITCNVDQLRLLGNGVVPQCAEKAIRELMRLFMQGCDDGSNKKIEI